MRQRVKYWNAAIDWLLDDGKYHRNGNLPARYYLVGGKLYFVDYYRHDNLHCTTGPAIIDYEKKIKEYFYQGKQYASLEEILMLKACR